MLVFNEVEPLATASQETEGRFDVRSRLPVPACLTYLNFKLPITKIPLSSQLMYFAFLASFAYALLVKQPRKSRASGTMDNAEFVVYVWTVSIIPVEIRQVICRFLSLFNV